VFLTIFQIAPRSKPKQADFQIEIDVPRQPFVLSMVLKFYKHQGPILRKAKGIYKAWWRFLTSFGNASRGKVTCKYCSAAYSLIRPVKEN